MDSTRPTYMDFLVALSATGRATRPAVEVERLLAACKHCPRWADGCGAMSPQEFAKMLADAGRSCQITFPASVAR
jgi:hypothetical protein